MWCCCWCGGGEVNHPPLSVWDIDNVFRFFWRRDGNVGRAGRVSHLTRPNNQDVTFFSASFGELVIADLLLWSGAFDEGTGDDVLRFDSSADGDDTGATAAVSPEGALLSMRTMEIPSFPPIDVEGGGRTYRNAARIVDRMTREATSNTSHTHRLCLGKGPDEDRNDGQEGSEGSAGTGTASMAAS
jgi:hypothetical protein